MEIAKFDERLLRLEARNIAKALNLYMVKAESAVVTDASAYAIQDPPPPQQGMNFEVVNGVCSLVESVQNVLTGFPDHVLAITHEAEQVGFSIFSILVFSQ